MLGTDALNVARVLVKFVHNVLILCWFRRQSKAEAAAAALGALSSAPRPLWLPLAAAVAPLIDSCPPAFDLADTQALLLRLQVTPLTVAARPTAGILYPDFRLLGLSATSIEQQLTATDTLRYAAESFPASSDGSAWNL